MQKIFIVANDYGNGLNIRSKPETSNNKTVTGHMAEGEAFTAYDIFQLKDETWARLSQGNGAVQRYAMISKGNHAYAREQTQQPLPILDTWVEAVDRFLRERGFMGPRP